MKRIRLRLAEVLAQAGRREETLDAARRVLEIEPHQIEELDRVYSVFAHLKAWPDAVRAYEAKANVFIQAGDVSAGGRGAASGWPTSGAAWRRSPRPPARCS